MVVSVEGGRTSKWSTLLPCVSRLGRPRGISSAKQAPVDVMLGFDIKVCFLDIKTSLTNSTLLGHSKEVKAAQTT